VSTFPHKLIVDEFRQHGGTLTGPQIAAVAGWRWRRHLAEMIKLGYPLIESPTDLWHLDLEALPDVGRAAVEDPPCAEGSSSAHGPEAHPAGLPAKVDSSSPDAEHETPTLPLEVEGPRPASPYDPSVEAA